MAPDLTDYVAGIAERVISDKEAAGRVPAAALVTEITERLRLDVVKAMRALHARGDYRLGHTVNKYPMLMRP